MIDLPLNCEVSFHPKFLDQNTANQLYQKLWTHYKKDFIGFKTIHGEAGQYSFGKVMFVDQELIDQNKFPEPFYSGVKAWPDFLLATRNKIEYITGCSFQTCVCIYYPDGNSGVDYHADLVAFGDTNIIPSLSLGAEREFKLREQSSQREHKIMLPNGSLIIMGDQCQQRYEHSLSLAPAITSPRINITFRKYGYDE